MRSVSAANEFSNDEVTNAILSAAYKKAMTPGTLTNVEGLVMLITYLAFTLALVAGSIRLTQFLWKRKPLPVVK
jgi:hypothetical protein